MTTTISTWDVLVSLGFAVDADEDVPSEDKPGLCYWFGKFKLTAGHFTVAPFPNIHLRQAVVLGGILSYRGSFAMIDNELPVELKSREQGMAWLSWTLDQAAGGKFQPALEPAWLEIGRQNQHLLPWNRELAAYEARPRCSVPREWLRLGLRELAEQITNVANDAPVIFSFDGSVLRISCNGKIIPVPAEGKSWEHVYSIPAAKLNWLPKRLMRELIEVSFDDSFIRIANRCYSGAEVIDNIETTGSSSAEKDERVGGSAGESGGTLAPKAGELPEDGKDVATETVSGSDDGSLPDRTVDTTRTEPDGTGVPAEGVNNKAIAATVKMVRAQIADGVVKFADLVARVVELSSPATARKLSAYLEAAWEILAETNSALDPAGKVADVLGPEKEVADGDNNEAGTPGRSETPPDTSVGGSAGESGGTPGPKVGELPSDGNDVATETVCGPDGVSLLGRTDGTAKPEPDGTGVPAEGVNNNALGATAKLVRASNNTKMPDSTRQALRDYANAVRKRAYMQSRNASLTKGSATKKEATEVIDTSFDFGANVESATAPMGLSPEQMRASARLVRAALDHGVSKFNEFVAYVVDRFGEPVALQAAEGIELAWKTLKRLPKYSGIDDAGKVADVLGPEKEVTDDEQWIEVEAHETRKEMNDLELLSLPGLNMKAVGIVVDMAEALITDGVVKFAEFIVAVAKVAGEATTRKLSRYLEMAWEVSRETNSDLDPAGKVADVLGPEKEVTDEKRPERNESTGDGGRETAGRPLGEKGMEETSPDIVSTDGEGGDAGRSGTPGGGRSEPETSGTVPNGGEGAGSVPPSPAGNDRPSGRSGRLKDAFFKKWWPIQGQEKELAFAMTGEVTAIPIYLHETEMTWDDYLDRMRTRLKWMREMSDLPNPNRWYRRQWWEKASVDVAVKNLEDHVHSPDFQEMLQNNGVEPEMFPLHPKPTPGAVDSIQELDLTGWLELALPSREWD